MGDRRVRRTLIIAAAAAVAALLVGCKIPGAAGQPTVKITGLGWVEENIAPDFWTSTTSQTAYYDFWIGYSGSISYSDISFARVYRPDGGYWTIDLDSSYLDTKDGIIGGWGRWYSASQSDVLPIGPLKVEVKLTDGADSTYTATIPAPGSTTAGSDTTMYSQDDTSPPASSAPMVPRATGGGGTISTSANTITVNFSVSDPSSLVYDGYLFFYDSLGNYLGYWNKDFVDISTGKPDAAMGSGGFNTNGTNTVTVNASDITFNSGATFGQIAEVRVVLTDGKQYASASGTQSGTYLDYDCRSISSAYTL